LGALLNHVTGGANPETFQPMNINFGLFPEIDNDRDERGRWLRGRERKQLYAIRARAALTEWMTQ